MPHIDRRCEGGVVDVFWCAGYDDSLLCSDDCFCFQMVGVNGGGRPNGGLCGCINMANSCGAEFLGVLGWGSAYFLPCLSCLSVCMSVSCLHFRVAPAGFFTRAGGSKCCRARNNEWFHAFHMSNMRIIHVCNPNPCITCILCVHVCL